MTETETVLREIQYIMGEMHKCCSMIAVLRMLSMQNIQLHICDNIPMAVGTVEEAEATAAAAAVCRAAPPKEVSRGTVHRAERGAAESGVVTRRRGERRR